MTPARPDAPPREPIRRACREILANNPDRDGRTLLRALFIPEGDIDAVLEERRT
jgi:hypothetical protein